MLSGNLTITVVAAEAVPQCKEDLVVAEVAEVPQLNCYVEIQVDGAIVQQTQVLENCVKPEWNETFEDIHLEENQKEISFLVKHKGHIESEVLAQVAFQIPDFLQECRRPRASTVTSQTASRVCREHVRQRLDPKGALILNICFEEETEEPGMALGGRNQANVERMYPVKGHRFYAETLVVPRRCGQCQDYMWGIGKQAVTCKRCKMSCHKDCLDSVLVPCQGRILPDNHDGFSVGIPHTFRLKTFGSLTYCTHCQRLLWGVIHQGYSCTIPNCNFVCHSHCRQYAGQFCGVDPTVLSAVIQSIELKAAKRNLLNEPKRVDSKIKLKPSTEKVTLKDFNLKAVLGKGAFGKVFLAETVRSRTKCAIKAVEKQVIIDADDVEITMLERYVLSLGHHCRFLTCLHASFQTAEHLFFVMEFLGGGDLMHHMMHSRKFTEPRAQFYAAQVVCALQFLHGQNIIYRDLKLDNVLLTSEGHIKLADFGMCKKDMKNGLTNTFCGTPNYIAPEIVAEAEYGASVDWWALGVLLFEMVVGRSPFQSQSEDELFKMIQTEPVRFPSRAKLQEPTKQIIGKLLTKEPAQRLGCGPQGEGEVRGHPFFQGINWAALVEGELAPPFTPATETLNNFDKEFTSETPALDPVNMENEKMKEKCKTGFSGFSFTCQTP